MKYRWKLLILILGISIIPVVGLRTFGIYNVRMMADSLYRHIEAGRTLEARQRLDLVMSRISEGVAKNQKQIEMALFLAAFELRQYLLGGAPALSAGPAADGAALPSSPVEQRSAPIANPHRLPHLADYGGQVMPGLCLFQPDESATSRGREDSMRLEAAFEPVARAVSGHLGGLVLRQYVWLENGLLGVYPCQRKRLPVYRAEAAVWDPAGGREQFSNWTAPYADPVTGRAVSAAFLVLEDEDDETPLGAVATVTPFDVLVDPSPMLAGMPAGTQLLICTLARRSENGPVGAAVALRIEKNSSGLTVTNPSAGSQWLTSSDLLQLRQIVVGIAARSTEIREMPWGGKPSYWAYGPMPHHGTSIVAVVPKADLVEPGDDVLQAIRERLERVEQLTAGFLLLLVATIAILSALFSRKVTRPLDELARAARQLAGGNFDARVPVRSNDEFGRLGEIFNRVGPQLKIHNRMQRSLEVATEIQQHLLPEHPPSIEGLDIEGLTLYSEKTGGDYFDYLCVSAEKLCVVVGDVSDHGLPSAILMASVRALIRFRAARHGPLEEIISDVNREFAADVERSGDFVTLLLVRIDLPHRRLEWVRAGHEPAILYDPGTGSHTFLKGSGTALGVNADSRFESNYMEIRDGQILCLFTDGINEARNERGEMFGTQRLCRAIERYAHAPAKTIMLSILDEVEEYSASGEPQDDLTLVVVKFRKALDASNTMPLT